MQYSFKSSIFVFCFSLGLSWLFSTEAMATHNRAGEITYKHIPTAGEPYRYAFTITTYTKRSGPSGPADRDTLDIGFGDGSFGRAPRTNGPGLQGEMIGDDIYLNIYEVTHSLFLDHLIMWYPCKTPTVLTKLSISG